MATDIQARALRVSLIVGTLLAAINHGDKILTSAMLPLDWFKLGLSYLVPYGVSWYSAVRAQKASGN